LSILSKLGRTLMLRQSATLYSGAAAAAAAEKLGWDTPPVLTEIEMVGF
jgi:hypothetical protein